MSYCFWIDSIFHGHRVQGNHVSSGEVNSLSVLGNDDWRRKRKGREGSWMILLIPYGAKKSHPFHPHPKVGDHFRKWDLEHIARHFLFCSQINHHDIFIFNDDNNNNRCPRGSRVPPCVVGHWINPYNPGSGNCKLIVQTRNPMCHCFHPTGIWIVW